LDATIVKSGKATLHTSMTRQSILQTCVPPYRLPLFDALSDSQGGEFQVVAGDRFFDPSIRTCAEERPWFHRCHNRFLVGNRFLWQSGAAVKGLSGGPLVVEGNPRSLSTWMILFRARRRGQRVAVWGHARGRQAGVEKMGAGRRWMFSLADTIICYCYAEKEPLQRLFPYKQILVAGNAALRQADCYPSPVPPDSRVSVLFLGRLVPEKKPLLLLRALQLAQNTEPRIGAVIVGEGPERGSCEDFVIRAGVKGVNFVGAEFGQEALRRWADKCFVMASPGYVGLSVLHAQGFGLPVAFSEAEPNAPEVEILAKGVNALTFAPDLPESLADVLVAFYRGRFDWLARGDEFCRVVHDCYSLENMSQQFVKFFTDDGLTQI
jgi:glycosyltransferase involved in cell wall biosynthesis